MPRVLQCEICLRLAPEESSVGWLEVGLLGIKVPMIGEGSGPWTFCGWDCLRGSKKLGEVS